MPRWLGLTEVPSQVSSTLSLSLSTGPRSRWVPRTASNIPERRNEAGDRKLAECHGSETRATSGRSRCSSLFVACDEEERRFYGAVLFTAFCGWKIYRRRRRHAVPPIPSSGPSFSRMILCNAVPRRQLSVSGPMFKKDIVLPSLFSCYLRSFIHQCVRPTGRG